MRCIRQAYETIEDNIRWTDTNIPLLQAWLEKRSHRNVHEDLQLHQKQNHLNQTNEVRCQGVKLKVTFKSQI